MSFKAEILGVRLREYWVLCIPVAKVRICSLSAALLLIPGLAVHREFATVSRRHLIPFSSKLWIHA